MTIAFDNSYARLPEHFYVRLPPTPVAAPMLLRLNRGLAEELGLDADWLASPEGVEMLAGNRVATGSEPLAMAYAGHQFGNFVPQLGDGRALLLGEVVGRDGRRRDIHLKGSGPTPFSRRGDGRAALGPVLREYIISEAMHALGVPTTRTLAAVATGEAVQREELLPGAVLARVASSHIRIGTFQYLAARSDLQGVKTLADHVIARHYPHAADSATPYLALYQGAVAAQAALVAQWMSIGFIHGVLNTDNMSIAGETIDYGPCAFMDEFHPATVFSSIDQLGRYAYGNQPGIVQWNLARLAETLLPLMGTTEDEALARAQEALSAYKTQYEAAYRTRFARKLGIADPRAEDDGLVRDLLQVMADQGADFTLTFRRLCDAAADPRADAQVEALLVEPSGYRAWAERWRLRLAEEPGDAQSRRAAMRAVNPAFIPRNHRVEAALTAATERGDLQPFEALLGVLARPFDDQPGRENYATPPAADERVLQTFCGT